MTRIVSWRWDTENEECLHCPRHKKTTQSSSPPWDDFVRARGRVHANRVSSHHLWSKCRTNFSTSQAPTMSPSPCMRPDSWHYPLQLWSFKAAAHSILYQTLCNVTSCAGAALGQLGALHPPSKGSAPSFRGGGFLTSTSQPEHTRRCEKSFHRPRTPKMSL